MIDVRDRDAIVARLRAAQRSFERGAPVPPSAREFLRDLADALGGSGPLELGVPSYIWLDAVRTADRGVERMDTKPSSRTVRHANRSLRKLELFFSGKHTWSVHLLRACFAALLIWIPPLIVVDSHDHLRAALSTAAVISALVGLGFLIAFVTNRYKPDVEATDIWLDVSDRQLFASSVNASGSEVRSFARANLGAYIHPVLIATDRRLLLARPINDVPGRSNSNEFEFVWEIPYTDITTFSSRNNGGDSPNEIVTIQSGRQEISYQLGSADGKALVAIIKRRAPEAFTESTVNAAAAHPEPAAPKSAHPLDTVASRSRPPRWLWWGVMPYGLGAWMPLLAGITAGKRHWRWTGGALCLVSLAAWALLPFADRNETVSTIAGLLLLAGWITGCVATWKIRGEYAAQIDFEELRGHMLAGRPTADEFERARRRRTSGED